MRRNVLVMFMCVELMLNAVNLTFVTFARMLDDIGGQSSVFFVLVVAAAEVVVGLAIIVAMFRRAGRGHRRRHPQLEGLSRPPMNAAYVILALPLAGFAHPAVRRAPASGDPLVRLDGHRRGGGVVRGHRGGVG